VCFGVLVPGFSDFIYYYQLEVSHFEKFSISMLNVLGSFALFVSMFIYAGYLKDLPVRNMMIIASFMRVIGGIFTIMYLKDITLGMTPLTFVAVTGTVSEILTDAFKTMPAMVLFAKLMPKNVESSMFGLIAGILNFSNGFLSKQLGLLLNKGVGVTNSNLNDLWKLYSIMTVCCFLPLFFVSLLPSVEAVRKV
jgi:hypothetical protein